MPRKQIYALWLLAFGLKAVGASWDASYHFKYLRDLTQLPHVLNALGLMLLIGVLVYSWRHEPHQERGSLAIVALGVAIFGISIFLDDAYHRAFGIDLTTWSPAHFALYSGTLVMLLGVFDQAARDYNRGLISRETKIIFQLILGIFLWDEFWFPLLQQEQGVIAYYLFEIGKPLAGPDILNLITNFRVQVYGGIQDWLYASYIGFAATFLFALFHEFKLPRFTGTITAGGYIIFRAIMDIIFAHTQYQTSTVPYFLLPLALIFDLLFLWADKHQLANWFKIFAASALTVLVLGYVSLLTNIPPIHPPMPLSGILLACLTAPVGYLLAKGVRKLVGTLPYR